MNKLVLSTVITPDVQGADLADIADFFVQLDLHRFKIRSA